MKAIGIDIGTTGICGVLADAENGALLRSVTKNSEAFICGCADWEKIQSVDKVISLAKEILDALVDEDVAVIGVTGQMHGIVYINANGEAVSPLYTWQDGRGNLPYRGTTYAKYLNSFSGYGNVTDFYNRENGIRPRDAVSYCTVHDYFVMKLCSLGAPIMHASDAASLGCYDIDKNRFDYDVSVNVVNECKIAGLYRGIPVSVAIGDNQASVFSTLTDESKVLLNVGTGSQVSVVSDAPAVAENIETRPYFGGKYLIVGAALCGGRAYSVLKNFYFDVLSYAGEFDKDKIYDIMNKMLEKNTAAMLDVDTRFAGTRSNADISGSISGITEESFTPSALTFGVLRGMANELFSMYEKMNVRRCGIVGSGNGVRKNPALVRVLEEKFGAPMAFPAHFEEAAFGAALYGLVCCGAFKSAKEVQGLVKYE